MKNIRLFICLLCFVAALPTFAQTPEKNDNGKYAISERDYNNKEVEMADGFRADGKIYVVIATLSSVLAGMVVYMVMLERKVKKVEQMLGE